MPGGGRKKNTDNVNWRIHPARGVVLQSLEVGGFMAGMDHLKAEKVWDFFKKMPEFNDSREGKVQFKQFKARLAGHRSQSARDRDMAKRDAEACRKDRLIHPRKNHNQRGELVFDLHPAKQLLRMDIAAGLHKQLSPFELRKKRPAYKVFKLGIFTHRIYQEVKNKKFINFLETKRQKEVGPTIAVSKVAFHADLQI
jgi:hypothetical protein